MDKKHGVVEEKSYSFALKMIDLYKMLTEEKREFILSKQILPSSTSIGANIAEVNGAISIADFSSKVSISYKESLETKYWLRLLFDAKYIDKSTFEDLFSLCDELCKILFSILKTSRINKQ